MKWSEPKMVCFLFCLKGNMLLIEADCNWLGWDWDITTIIIRSYDKMISTSLHLLPSPVICAALSDLHGVAACHFQLLALSAVITCTGPPLPITSLQPPCSCWRAAALLLCTILGSCISRVQDCDVTSKAAVFILMSSSQPLTGGLAECWVIT